MTIITLSNLTYKIVDVGIDTSKVKPKVADIAVLL